MRISIQKYISSGLSKKPEENGAGSIDIKDDPLDSGGQGKIYEVTRIENKPVLDLLVKSFDDKEPIANITEIINIVRDKKDEYRIDQCTALKALPLFIFEGEINKKPIYGHVMHRVKGESLYNIFEDNFNPYINLPLKDRIRLCYQFVEGMNVLYNLTIVHADINSQNLMIDLKNMDLAIIDLDGGAVAKAGSTPLVIGKMDAGWLDPEIFKQCLGARRKRINVNISSDLWSIACGVHNLLFGLAPFFFIKEKPEMEDYLSRYKWPEFRGIKGIKIIMDSAFGYYERTFEQVPELHKLFKVSFNDGYSKPDRRISAAQWMIQIKDKLMALETGTPRLEINKTSFDYLNKTMNSSFSGSFTITNAGSGTLSGKITASTRTNTKWLKLSQSSIANKPRQDITFNIDTSGLSLGFKDIGTINVQSNGGNENISVNLSMENKPKPHPPPKPQPPKLEVSKSNFDFHGVKINSPIAGSFTIDNYGGGVLSGQIRAVTKSGKNWIKISKSNIDVKVQQIVSFNIDPSGLSPGFKDAGTIEIQSNVGNKSISINLSVENLAPMLEVSPANFEFNNKAFKSSFSGNFKITKKNSATLSGRITVSTRTNRQWLKVSQVNIADKDTQDITFNIDTSGLYSGFKDAGTIDIQSNGGNKSVNVNLSIEEVARGTAPVPVDHHVNTPKTTSHGTGTPTTYYCNICKKNTETKIEYKPHIKVTCMECVGKEGIREGKEPFVYRFTLYDKYAPCKCTEIEQIDTFHVIYITYQNHVVCFCVSCGREIRAEKPFKGILGWKYCHPCKKDNAALIYKDENDKEHYLCSFCGTDKII